MYDNTNFKKIETQFGNKYKAIQHIVKEARKKQASTNYNISSSEAISWVVDNKIPDNVKSGRAYEKRTTYVEDILNSYLNDIDDNEVRKCVEDSVNYSYTNSCLIFIYSNTLNTYEKSRVRILTRMIYDKIRKKGNI